MSLWVEDALKLLANPPDDLDVDKLGQRCQEQTVHAYRMEFLKNISGSVNSYRDACGRALTDLLAANEVKVPLLPVKPLDDDHPKVKDDYERARQRHVKALEERNKLLATARRHLEDAHAIAQRCMDWRPEHLTREEKPAKAKA